MKENIRWERKVRWTDIYDNEEELVADLMASADYERRYTKGYVYLESFKKRLEGGRPLTPKQMTQLKRLAYEVYKNVHWHHA